MKFSAKVSGEAALGLPEQDCELEAPEGAAAVDAVRAHLTGLLPKHGGMLDVEVSCLEEWSRIVNKHGGGTITETFPPGEVSRFSFYVEPHESVRSVVEAREADAELAGLATSERAPRRVELLVSLFAGAEISREQLTAALVDSSVTLESLVTAAEEPAAEKAVSK